MEKSSSSRGIASWLLWVLVALIGLAVLLALGGWAGFRYFVGKAEGYVEQFEAKGYKRFEARQSMVDQDFDEKRVYYGEYCRIRGDCSTDLALISQVAEVHGKVDGDLFFWGQTLLIKRDAVITGNLDAPWAQFIVIDGRVDGEISGFYQMIIDSEGPKSRGQKYARPPADSPTEKPDKPD